MFQQMKDNAERNFFIVQKLKKILSIHCKMTCHMLELEVEYHLTRTSTNELLQDKCAKMY